MGVGSRPSAAPFVAAIIVLLTAGCASTPPPDDPSWPAAAPALPPRAPAPAALPPLPPPPPPPAPVHATGRDYSGVATGPTAAPSASVGSDHAEGGVTVTTTTTETPSSSTVETIVDTPVATTTTTTTTETAGPAGAGAPAGAAGADDTYELKRVWVHYATDRNIRKPHAVRTTYGGSPGQLTYGVASVTIPPSHRRGELEEPWFFEISESARRRKYITLETARVWDRDRWLASLRQRIAASPKRRALLFVHGFNVSFDEAARRTAQIAYDVRFDGAVMMYSWPSAGSMGRYMDDLSTAQVSQPRFAQVMNHLLTSVGAQEVYLIAHSMGNLIVTETLKDLAATNPKARGIIKEVVLAAPDIDKQVFEDRIASALPKAAQRVTLYASNADLAFNLTKPVRKRPRAGSAGKNLIVYPPIETIDATRVETEFLGHSYIGDSPTVLADLYYLINHGLSAAERSGLEHRKRGNATYWEFRP